jgi:hypothetical protein
MVLKIDVTDAAIVCGHFDVQHLFIGHHAASENSVCSSLPAVLVICSGSLFWFSRYRNPHRKVAAVIAWS